MKNIKLHLLLPSLALALFLGVTLPVVAADGPAPAPPAPLSVVAAAPACPSAHASPASPEAPAPAPLFEGLTPPPQPAACPPLAAGCCIIWVSGRCPMCDGFDCEDP